MEQFNSYPLNAFSATVAKAFGIEPPALAHPPLDWVVEALGDYCKEGYDRLLFFCPDATGMRFYKKYPDAFAPVLKNTQITVPFLTPMPPVTPVCFGTMFTGAEPAEHGIVVYEKRTLTVDTLFDALLRAGKKVAIVSQEYCSMSTLFLDRGIDLYNAQPEGNIITTAQTLIAEDNYDVILVYAYMVDFLDHWRGPDHPETVSAVYNMGIYFDNLISTVRRNWKNHNTLVTFSPDHGCHAVRKERPNGKILLGDHHDDIPDDRNILHFIGSVIGENHKPKEEVY